jgi:TPR repeat protein
MYRDGLGVPVNVGSAKAYFQAAAQMDLAEAKVHLGELAGESHLHSERHVSVTDLLRAPLLS